LVRQKLRRHNLQVLAFCFVCGVGSVVAWSILYFIARWLSLLGLAIAFGPYAKPPPGFGVGFAAVGASLLFSAWLDQKVTPNQLPPDEKSPREILMDFVLAVPRMTLAIVGNLSAWLTLGRQEIHASASLLERVSQVKRLPIHETPLEIPERNCRENVISALLLLGLLEMHKADDVIWLRLPGSLREAFRFAALE
jgi:hypothetical protein